MGMYTEIYVNVDLKSETPESVIDAIRAICEKNSLHPALYGKPERWSLLFNDGSGYTPSTECGQLTYHRFCKKWSLIGKGDIKNYNNEIEEFFKWLMPWVDANEGEFIGYHRYEESHLPTLITKENA